MKLKKLKLLFYCIYFVFGGNFVDFIYFLNVYIIRVNLVYLVFVCKCIVIFLSF